jgi:hypothetical protein
MRPGDSIVVSRAEADLLTGDTFQGIAPKDLVGKIVLTPTEPGSADYYRLALPRVGRRVVTALTEFAGSEVDPKDAIMAEGLAVAIAQRIAA